MKISITTLLFVLPCAMAQCTTSFCDDSPVENKILEEEVLARFREEIRLLRTSVEAIHATMKEANTGFTNKLETLKSDLASQIANVSAVCRGSPVTFLRRQDGSVNFTRPWSEYRDGFGDPAGEFWLGLSSLHRLTTQTRYRLRVDLVDWSGETKWAEYGHFAVGPASDKYRLSISDYATASTAGDSMMYAFYSQNGMAFTTIDQDNDLYGVNCAAYCGGGGWWYRSCGYAWLTGQYKPAGDRSGRGILWYQAYNENRSFKAATLTLVPV